MEFTRLEWLWTSSWQAAALACVVLLVQAILGRGLSARWRHALWWVVVAKLLIPATVPLPVSVYPEWSGLAIHPLPAHESLEGGERRGSLRVPLVSLVGDATASAGAPVDTTATLSVGEGSEAGAGSAPSLNATNDRRWWEVGSRWLPWIWVVGAMSVLVRQCVHGLVLARRLKSDGTPASPQLLRKVEWCRNELGIRRPVRLCLVPWLSGAAVFGWRKPMILLPEAMASELDERSLRHVVLHELAHVRRGDLGMNLVLVVLQALHWFNPVLWLAFRRMRADRELAADEVAMACLETSEAREYGATLIRALEWRAGLRSAQVALGMVGGKACLRRRIQAVARFDGARRGGLLGRVALGLLLVVGFAGRARETKPQDSAEAPVMTNYYRVERRVRSVTELETRIAEIRDAETKWITGEIVDESGKTISEVRVVVAPFREPRLHREVEVKQGRFEVAVLDAEERVVAIHAPGFAPRFMRRAGDKDRAARRIVLNRGRPLEGVVVDEEGTPLMGVGFALQSDAGERMDDPLIRLEVTTDEGGRFRWPHAPLTSERLVAAAPGFEPAMVEILPSQPSTAEFRLRRAFELKVRVVDAATGEAVEPNAVFVRWIPWGFRVLDGSRGWQRTEGHLRIETSPGEVRVQPSRRFNAVPGDLQLQIAAAGYRPTTTEAVKLSGVQEVRVNLPKASPWRGRILDPEGKPVPGGQIVTVGEGTVMLDRGHLRALDGLGPLVVQADAQGEFELPPALPSLWVVASHTNAGFAEITMMDLEQTKEVRLRPWGRIEGALTSKGEGVEGVEMSVKRVARVGPSGLDLTEYRSLTDGRGRFRFDHVPPGLLLLSRSWAMGGPPFVRRMVPQKLIEVRAGEISEATLASSGRTIVGKVLLSPGERPAASYFGHHGMFRKRAQPPGPEASRADHEAWAKIAGSNATVEYPTVYPAVWIGDDGRFAIENVPPGTFELRFGFEDWPTGNFGGLPRTLGSISKDVVVPESAVDGRDEPMDVGILRLKLGSGDDEW
ncbi:MAG: hypothetical protein JNK85_23875 [Verrucomicrobiales bacterium]|nr:hypothetical protein [Verrucomicrobiales bacterium]